MLSTTNLSLIQIITRFQDFADKHRQLNGFGVGTVFEINTTTQTYAQLWVEILPANFTLNTVQYNFRVYLMDILTPDIRNEIDIQSDMMQVMWDLVFSMRDNYDYEPVYSNQIIPFTENFDDRVAGVFLDLGVIIPRDFGVCDIPKEPC